MGKLVAVLPVLCSVFVSAISRLFADEFKEWTPWIVQKLLSTSVRLLPAMMRNRYSEEWLSYLDEIPGYAGKLLGGVGLLIAAMRVRSRTLRTQKRFERMYKRWIESRLHQPGPPWLHPKLEELRSALDGLLRESLRSIEVEGEWTNVEKLEKPFINCCDCYDAFLKCEPKKMS